MRMKYVTYWWMPMRVFQLPRYSVDRWRERWSKGQMRLLLNFYFHRLKQAAMWSMHFSTLSWIRKDSWR